MAQEKITQEFIAVSVEEAVEQGSKQLGLPKEMLDVEILDAGSKGLFGLGSRHARVRLSIKNVEPTPKPAKTTVTEKPVAARPAAAKPEKTVASKPAAVAPEKVVVTKDTPNALEQDKVLQIAKKVVSELLEKMHIQAQVDAKFLPPVDEHDQHMVTVEIQGRDLSILIGRRSETLNAIQYISSLIVAKEYGEWVPLMIDVQGYRERRERQLRVLARRMAEQVIHTGRRQNLEPMPANERRVIHLELRDHEMVATESAGEEPNRKVTIFLKKQK
jgi:spoIIIJ-associated protein